MEIRKSHRAILFLVAFNVLLIFCVLSFPASAIIGVDDVTYAGILIAFCASLGLHFSVSNDTGSTLTSGLQDLWYKWRRQSQFASVTTTLLTDYISQLLSSGSVNLFKADGSDSYTGIVYDEICTPIFSDFTHYMMYNMTLDERLGYSDAAYYYNLNGECVTFALNRLHSSYNTDPYGLYTGTVLERNHTYYNGLNQSFSFDNQLTFYVNGHTSYQGSTSYQEPYILFCYDSSMGYGIAHRWVSGQGYKAFSAYTGAQFLQMFGAEQEHITWYSESQEPTLDLSDVLGDVNYYVSLLNSASTIIGSLQEENAMLNDQLTSVGAQGVSSAIVDQVVATDAVIEAEGTVSDTPPSVPSEPSGSDWVGGLNSVWKYVKYIADNIVHFLSFLNSIITVFDTDTVKISYFIYGAFVLLIFGGIVIRIIS